MLEAAGPAFIKWGQWAATRHDLFPPDFCAILEHLHTQVPAPAVLSTREPQRSYKFCCFVSRPCQGHAGASDKPKPLTQLLACL